MGTCFPVALADCSSISWPLGSPSSLKPLTQLLPVRSISSSDWVTVHKLLPWVTVRGCDCLGWKLACAQVVIASGGKSKPQAVVTEHGSEET